MVKRLDEIIEYMESQTSPKMEDFQFIDQSMQDVNELVGKAIDGYLAERRDGGKSIFQRMYGMTKGIAACSAFILIVAVCGEFLSFKW